MRHERVRDGVREKIAEGEGNGRERVGRLEQKVISQEVWWEQTRVEIEIKKERKVVHTTLV